MIIVQWYVKCEIYSHSKHKDLPESEEVLSDDLYEPDTDPQIKDYHKSDSSDQQSSDEDY